MSNGPREVQARPSKEFFIDMITRDLSISGCILDLVDNSVDKAVETTGSDVMTLLTEEEKQADLSGATVEMEIDEDRFRIVDSCGGIGVEEAREEVFLFGNPGERGARSGLSVYGIGMKRAFFKLGRLITIRSVTDEDWFRMVVDVDEWKKRPKDWTFQFDDYGDDPDDAFRTTPGTEIIVRELRDEVRKEFSRTRFINRLKEDLAATYSLFIEAGLRIEVNGERIESALPEMGTWEKMSPARRRIVEDGVEILVLAGVTPRSDKEPRGWYIFCNGRLVVGPDREERTGWGDGLPKWHSKYTHFVGYVYFRSEDVRKLPWTTTKKDVVVESSVYQSALREMSVQGRLITNFLNRMYPSDMEEENVAEREVIDESDSVPINELPQEESSFSVDVSDKQKDAGEKRVWIQYKRKRKELDKIKQCVDKLKGESNKAIGEYTFEYFMRQECE